MKIVITILSHFSSHVKQIKCILGDNLFAVVFFAYFPIKNSYVVGYAPIRRCLFIDHIINWDGGYLSQKVV